MQYTYPTIPEPLPETLDELKALGDAVNAVRTQAASDVQEGREAMDECDRLLKRLTGAVDKIMGIKAAPTREEKEHLTPDQVHQKGTVHKPGEKVPPHSPSA